MSRRWESNEEQRATTFELLFDLVYVFAVTQVTGYMARHVSHDGERPMGITWRLRQPTPEDLFVETAAVLATG